MSIIQATGIRKAFGERIVLDFEKFTLERGDKIGLVGSNGAGKTTLLEILAGETEPDEGHVRRWGEAAYIRQIDDGDQSAASGGERVKKRILTQLSANDRVVMADEPTANLDAEGRIWVRQRLEGASALILVSHDRDLLDALCNKIIELQDGKLTEYTGNYSDYKAALAHQRENQEIRYQEYVRKRAQLERGYHAQKSKASHADRAPGRMGNSEARLDKNKGAAKQAVLDRKAKILKNRLERMETVEKVREGPRINIDFSLTDPPANKIVVEGRDVCFAYGDKVIFDHADFVVPVGEKVLLAGRNGAGKTTLLNLIQQGYQGISRAPKLKLGRLHQSFGNLDTSATVLENAMAQSVQPQGEARNLLACLLFRGDEVYKSAGVLSGGERMRLGLAKLILSDCNALLLDEPTNYLDAPAIEAVQQVIADYKGTVLLVCHDEAFAKAVTTRVLLVDKGKIADQEAYRDPVASDEQQKARRRLLLDSQIAMVVSQLSGGQWDMTKDELEDKYAQLLKERADL